jgi:hypothetical protein
MDASAMVKLLREIAEATLDKSDFYKLSPILDQIDIVRDDRNLVVHGLWAVNSYGTPIASSLRADSLASGVTASGVVWTSCDLVAWCTALPVAVTVSGGHSVDAAQLECLCEHVSTWGP